MKKFRVGIIGCGGIANGKHMPTLSKMKDVEIVAFCDIIPERAEAAAKKYGVPLSSLKRLNGIPEAEESTVPLDGYSYLFVNEV